MLAQVPTVGCRLIGGWVSIFGCAAASNSTMDPGAAAAPREIFARNRFHGVVARLQLLAQYQGRIEPRVPAVGGHQVTYSVPGWYIAALHRVVQVHGATP